MADMTEPQGLPLLSDYTRFVRRNRLAVSVLTCLGLLIGVALSTTHPAKFSATASLTLTQVPTYLAPLSPAIPPPPVTIDTDAQLLQSPAVRKAVAQELGTDTDTAATRISVSATAVSNVLHVTVTARNPQAAANAANAAASALLQVRTKDLGSLQGPQLRQLRAVVEAQENTLALEQKRGVIIPADDDVFTELMALQTTLREIVEAKQTPGDIVDAAVPPTHHLYPNTEVPIVSGGMLGFLAGVLLGIGLDRRRRTRSLAPAPLLTNPFGGEPPADTRHKEPHYV